MTAPRPYALLGEITYRCPLHCPYCSNPAVASAVLSGAHARQPSTALRTAHTTAKEAELTTDEWKRVIRDAAALGVLQIGFSGGEPLVRRDLAELVHAAREATLYTNLITSGIGFDDDRIAALRDAGLDSVQLSSQSDHADLADQIPRARAHLRPLEPAANPTGDVLAWRTGASAIADVRVENVRARALDWIWRESESFNLFRGTEWMPEPCRSCPQKEIDFGGCRCQAALLTGSAANTDPVCTLSPNRARVDAVLRNINSSTPKAFGADWTYRVNPKTLDC